MRRSYATTVIRLTYVNTYKTIGGLLADQIVLLSTVIMSIGHYFNSRMRNYSNKSKLLMRLTGGC
jgi:hypothetical protein